MEQRPEEEADQPMIDADDADVEPGHLHELGADPAEGLDTRGVLARRPAETAAGLGLAGAVYGFLAEQGGLPNELAAVVAVVVAFAPGLLSYLVDAVRGE